MQVMFLVICSRSLVLLWRCEGSFGVWSVITSKKEMKKHSPLHHNRFSFCCHGANKLRRIFSCWVAILMLHNFHFLATLLVLGLRDLLRWSVLFVHILCIPGINFTSQCIICQNVRFFAFSSFGTWLLALGPFYIYRFKFSSCCSPN